MSAIIRKAAEDDLETIFAMYREAIADKLARGDHQWTWGDYPNADMLREDARLGRLSCAEDDSGSRGAFVACPGQSEEYAALSWHFGVKPCTLHRLALRPSAGGKGYGRRIVQYAMDEGRRRGCDCFRVDTFSENERALKLFRSMTTRYVGDVYFHGHEEPFHAFEKPLTDDCPLLPMRMRPAYRYGDSTPWGGDGLRKAFGLEIPDARTGEALEISAIPGLESRDDIGDKLTDLLDLYGARLAGEKHARTFPLLLKLIAAREQLSVQVHPGDDYAARNERKLGKSEAWVILHADEGAHILYGLKDGVTVEALRSALKAGDDIEPMIDSVPARAGDVFYMPSGMVHAIGGGVVLYEIQQSSDVTYRLWDYNRVNAKGEKRPLHLKQALDVIDPNLRGERKTLPDAPGLHRVLDVPAFALDCACVSDELTLERSPKSFRLITALSGTLLRWEGDALDLAPGESALLPASCPELTLTGAGRALIAQPR